MCLLIVAAGLRFYDLPGTSVSSDEAIASNNSSGALSEVIPGTNCCNTSPILYPLALWAVQKVDVSAFSLRVLPAAASVLTVAVMLFLLPRLGVARGAAFLAALLATLSVEAIRHAQDAREYSIDTLLAVLMTAGLLWYLRDGRKALLCVSLLLAPLLQYGLVLFGVAVLGAAVILLPSTLAASEGNSIRNWIERRIGLVLPAVCFLVGCAISYAVTLRYQWQEGGFASGGYLSEYYYQGKFDAPAIFEFSIDGIWSLLTYHLTGVVAMAALATFSIILVARLLRKFRGKFPDSAIAVLFSLCIAVSVGAALLSIYPLGDIRANLYLGPIVFLTVGVAFHWTADSLSSLTRRAWLAPALVVAAVGATALAGVSDIRRQDNLYHHKGHNAEAVLAFLEENVEEGDMVYIDYHLVSMMKFYQDEKPSSYHYGKAGCWPTLEERCIREIFGLGFSLPNIPNRIFLVHHSAVRIETTTTPSGEAGITDRVGNAVSAYLVNDKSHWADDNPPQPWRWQRADALPGDANTPDDATWTDIVGARSSNYTLRKEDRGKFLRAYVSYEKNGITYQVQTDAISTLEVKSGLELLGEQVPAENVLADGYFHIALVANIKESVVSVVRAAYESVVSGEPVIRSDFDVYLSEDTLTYVKEPCARADTEAMFFLHLLPVDVNDLPDHRKQHGFDNLGFDLKMRGAIFDGRCVAKVALPEYDIVGISTGQYGPVDGGYENIWEGEFVFDKALLSAYEAVASDEPAIRSDFDVYLSENTLTYVKEACVSADTEAMFFLALFPVDVNDLPDHRRQHGFDNLDFRFDRRGVIFDGGRCVATVALPEYDVARISTGQYVPVGGGYDHIWEGEIRLAE